MTRSAASVLGLLACASFACAFSACDGKSTGSSGTPTSASSSSSSSGSGSSSSSGSSSGSSSACDLPAPWPVDTSLPPVVTTPPPCASLGSVQFHLFAPTDDDAGLYTATTYTWLGDSVNWFSVSSTDGGPDLAILPPATNGLYAWSPSCSSCTGLDVAPLFQVQPIGDAGVTGAWNGRAYTASTCADRCTGASTACGDPQCAAAGEYVATLCAFEPQQQSSRCVTVPFAYPSANDVTGTITP